MNCGKLNCVFVTKSEYLVTDLLVSAHDCLGSNPVKANVYFFMKFEERFPFGCDMMSRFYVIHVILAKIL